MTTGLEAETEGRELDELLLELCDSDVAIPMPEEVISAEDEREFAGVE
jgi:hypothetical protein